MGGEAGLVDSFRDYGDEGGEGLVFAGGERLEGDVTGSRGREDVWRTLVSDYTVGIAKTSVGGEGRASELGYCTEVVRRRWLVGFNDDVVSLTDTD